MQVQLKPEAPGPRSAAVDAVKLGLLVLCRLQDSGGALLVGLEGESVTPEALSMPSCLSTS